MCKKESQVISLFTLSGSTSVKAEHKYVGEIEPYITWAGFYFNLITDIKKIIANFFRTFSIRPFFSVPK